jgi:hypothetical protein
MASSKTVAVVPGILEVASSGQYAIQTVSVPVGDSPTFELLVTATGIPGWAPQGYQNVPGQVWLQPRQNALDPLDHGWHDQFTIQYIGGAVDDASAYPQPMRITFKLLREDDFFDPSGDIGWGQELQVDVLLISNKITAPS